MARPRKKPSTEAAATAAASTSVKCPECGREFSRPAALGAHRKRAHGVAGATSAAKPRAKRQTRRTAAAAQATNGRRSQRTAAAGVDRDALLQQLFPTGIPARESVISRLNSWLDEAEKLAALK